VPFPGEAIFNPVYLFPKDQLSLDKWKITSGSALARTCPGELLILPGFHLESKIESSLPGEHNERHNEV
jgi:hypothetical protein